MATAKVNTYQYGTTVRFEVKFYDFDGQPTDPNLIKIVIYNGKYQQIFSEVVAITNRTNVGEYYFDYTTERKEQKLYYEWYGEIDGKPSLMRESFITKFI